MTFMERHVPDDIRTAVANAPHLGDESVHALLALAAAKCTKLLPFYDDADRKSQLVAAGHLYVAARLMIRHHTTGKEWADPDMVLGVLLVAEDLIAQIGPDMGVAEALQHLTATMPMHIEPVTPEPVTAGS